MGSIRRPAVTLALAIAVVLGGEAGEAAGQGKVVFVGGSVYHSQVIPAGAIVPFKVTCPPPSLAVGGSVSSADPSVLPLLSQPAPGGKAWSFAFRNSDNKDHTVVVVVNCIGAKKIAGGLATLVVKKKKKKLAVPVTTTVPAGQTSSATAICPKITSPTGETVTVGGSGKAAAQAAAVGGLDLLQVTGVVPGPRTMTVDFRNGGVTDATVTVGAVCVLRRVEIGGGARLRTGLTRGSFPIDIPAGGGVVSGQCSGIPVDAGFSLPPTGTADFVGAGFRSGALGVSWAFTNSSKSPVAGSVNLSCIPGRAKFVRGDPGTSAGSTIETAVGPITITG